MIYTRDHQSDCQSNSTTTFPHQQQQQPEGTIVLTLPADGSRPQLLTLTNTFSPAMDPESLLVNTTAASGLDTTCYTSSSTMATTPISSTILDLTSMINSSQVGAEVSVDVIHEEPLDLSTPTMRESLTLASSLGLSEADIVTTSTSNPKFTMAEDSKVIMRPHTVSSVTNSNASPTVIDPELAYAALTAVTSGSITPLVKEELKCTIQQKRLSEGKGELMVKFDDPKPSKLSADEEGKRQRRRERNRVAAQKCRNKRRERADVLQDESVELETKNQSLRDEIAKLEEEKERLRHMLATHDILPTKCNMKLSISEDDDCSVSTYTTRDDLKDDDDHDVMDGIMEDSDEDDLLFDQVV